MLCLCRLLPVSPRCRRPLCDVIETATSQGLRSEEQDSLHLDTFPNATPYLFPFPTLPEVCLCFFTFFFSRRSPGHFRASLALIALIERKTKRDVHATRSQRPIKRPQLFSIINRCATCCLSSHPAAKLTVKPVLCLFARRQKIKKKRETSVTFYRSFSKKLRSALSMTSIKPNECGAQRVRPWDIRCAIRVSNQRRQPSALSGINRSAIGARRVVECARGVVNRL